MPKVNFKVTDSELQKINKMKRLSGMGDKPIKQWILNIAKDIPLQDTPAEMISRNTQHSLSKMWMENFADNMPDILWARIECTKCGMEYEVNTWSEREVCRYCGKSVEVLQTRNVSEFPKFNGKAGIVVAAGPSVRPELGSPHLDMIANDWNGCTIVTDRMTGPVLEKGIIPTIVSAVDGHRKLILKWFDKPIVKEYAEDLNVLCSITVANSVIKYLNKIGANLYFYTPLMDQFGPEFSLSRRMAMMGGVTCLSSGGNVGTQCMVVGYYLHCNPIGIVGMDLGYREGDPIENTPYYSTIVSQCGGDVSLAEKSYRRLKHPYFGTNAVTDEIFWYYKEAFLDLMRRIRSLDVVNCTEGGILFGDGVRSMWLKDFIAEYTDGGVEVPISERFFAAPPLPYESVKKEEVKNE